MTKWTMETYDHLADQAAAKAIRDRFAELDPPPFECLGGWYPLIERLLEDVRAALPAGKESELRVNQIKEKFGGLSFYVNYGPIGRAALDEDERSEAAAEVRLAIEKAIFLACCRADRTCEVCSQRGIHVLRGGWHMTRCREHADGSLPGKFRRRARMRNWEYDEVMDAVVDLSGMTLAQHLQREAERLREPILSAVIGTWKGAPAWVEAEGWPGWVDPVPRHKRLYVEPWDRAGPALSYDPFALKSMHPVTAWTEHWVLVARLDFNGTPEVSSYPRSPQAYEQELRT